MPVQIVILEPGFISENDGHHFGYNGMLGVAASKMGHDPVIVAHEWSHLGSMTYDGVTLPVRPLLRQYLYQTPQFRSLQTLLEMNESAYQSFAALPPSLFAPASRLMVHTVNETQVLGLARYVVAEVPRRFESAVVGLMLPPPVTFAEDGSAVETDPGICEVYRQAITLLHGHPSVRIMGIGATVAEDHERSAGLPVEPGAALIAGIGRPFVPRPEPHRPPNVLLFAGDAKLDKNFHLIPALISLIRRRDLRARFNIQISGGMAADRYAWIVREIRAAAEGDDRFALLEGRLDEAGYHALWDGTDLVVAAYHPGVYGRKSSGVCWDALNLGIPAVITKNTFHETEMGRYGHPITAASAFWPEDILGALGTALADLPDARRQALHSRGAFVKANQPERYVEALFDPPPVTAVAPQAPAAAAVPVAGERGRQRG